MLAEFLDHQHYVQSLTSSTHLALIRLVRDISLLSLHVGYVLCKQYGFCVGKNLTLPLPPFLLQILGRGNSSRILSPPPPCHIGCDNQPLFLITPNSIRRRQVWQEYKFPSLYYTCMHRSLGEPTSSTRKIGINDPTGMAHIAGVASYSEA